MNDPVRLGGPGRIGYLTLGVTSPPPSGLRLSTGGLRGGEGRGGDTKETL